MNINKTAILLASLLLATACAATQPAAEQRHPVIDRAEARWAALLGDDLETAYGFYSPGYRSTTSVVDFGMSYRLRKVHYTEAAYRDHECETDRCNVRFDVKYKLYNPVPGVDVYELGNVISETWVKTGGEWWFLPKK